MLILLLAMIGYAIDAGVAYWICFTIYCVIRLITVILEIIKDRVMR